MTATRVPDPAELAVRRATQAAADKVLTLLGVRIAMDVDLVEGPADDPGVFISFGNEPTLPGSGWSAMLVGDTDETLMLEVTPKSDPTGMPVPGPIDMETLCLLTDPDPQGTDSDQLTSADWLRGAAVLAALRAAWDAVIRWNDSATDPTAVARTARAIGPRGAP